MTPAATSRPADAHHEAAQASPGPSGRSSSCGSRSAARSGGRAASSASNAGEAAPGRRRGAPGRRSASASAFAASRCATLLGADRRRVLEALRELGQERSRLLGPGRHARGRRTLWPRWPCSARKASSAVGERVRRRAGASSSGDGRGAGSAEARRRAPGVAATSAGQRSSRRSTSWSSWTPPPISASASPGGASATTDS